MVDTQATEVPEVERKLATLQANKIGVLTEPIPIWPEKAAFLLSLLFVILIVDAPKDSDVAKALAIGLFMTAMGCQWVTTKKIRQKVEALSETVRNSST